MTACTHYVQTIIGVSVREPYTNKLNGEISDLGWAWVLVTLVSWTAGFQIGASTVSSTLVVKTENCLYICMCVFCIYILPYLCAMQYFHVAHWSMLVLCPAHAHLPAMVSWTKSNFLGLFPKWGRTNEIARSIIIVSHFPYSIKKKYSNIYTFFEQVWRKTF